MNFVAKQKILKILILSLSLSSISCEIVATDDGKIEGTTLQSRLNEDFYAFFKIPYGQPPLGHLRFQEPRPAEKWNGVLNGINPGPSCYQLYPREGESEDCLHLNVFSKNLTSSKPVIFFIHGGGYEAGSGLDQGPGYLIDRDVVIVTINYRLGAFGFLAMGTQEVPGNAGMKDQVLALKWVQKNIKHFGGNASKVTIAGYSAGGFSVTAHMASTMSKGLFHRAIAMSGSITTAMPLNNNNNDIAKKLGKLLSCDPQQLLECLMNIPAATLAVQVVKEYPECEVVLWMPVVEADFGQERFFVEDPSVSFQKGKFNKVPVIVGRTADEFISTVPALLFSSRMDEFNANFNQMAPRCFFYPYLDQAKSDTVSKALRKAFLPYESIDIRSFNGLNYLFGDGIIGFPVHKFVQLVSNFTKVYYYKFSFIGRYGYNYPHDKPYGVNHGDDLKYSFDVGVDIKKSDPENFMVERMTKIIEQFAVSGNPNYDLKLFKWPIHEPSFEFYMDINQNMIEKNGLFIERYAVWEKSLKKKRLDKKASRKEQILIKLGILEWDEL